MKRIAILIIAAIVGNAVFGQTKDSTKRDSFLLLEPVELKAIRAGENSPFTKTNLTKKQIEKAKSWAGPAIYFKSNAIGCCEFRCR